MLRPLRVDDWDALARGAGAVPRMARTVGASSRGRAAPTRLDREAFRARCGAWDRATALRRGLRVTGCSRATVVSPAKSAWAACSAVRSRWATSVTGSTRRSRARLRARRRRADHAARVSSALAAAPARSGASFPATARAGASPRNSACATKASPCASCRSKASTKTTCATRSPSRSGRRKREPTANFLARFVTRLSWSLRRPIAPRLRTCDGRQRARPGSPVPTGAALQVRRPTTLRSRGRARSGSVGDRSSARCSPGSPRRAVRARSSRRLR